MCIVTLIKGASAPSLIGDLMLCGLLGKAQLCEGNYRGYTTQTLVLKQNHWSQRWAKHPYGIIKALASWNFSHGWLNRPWAVEPGELCRVLLRPHLGPHLYYSLSFLFMSPLTCNLGRDLRPMSKQRPNLSPTLCTEPGPFVHPVSSSQGTSMGQWQGCESPEL